MLPNLRSYICSLLGVEERPDFRSYLGLPIRVGLNKREVFAFLKDKVRSKLSYWKRRLLPRAGKEIMLKSVLQALPIYFMNLFVLAKVLCRELQQKMSNFWWGKGKNHEKGVNWVSWDRMSRPKQFGGLGFKKLHEFNLVMVGTTAWKLVSYPDSLVARLIKAKYYPDLDFLNASLGKNPSYIWQSLYDCQNLIRNGAYISAGAGTSTSI